MDVVGLVWVEMVMGVLEKERGGEVKEGGERGMGARAMAGTVTGRGGLVREEMGRVDTGWAGADLGLVVLVSEALGLGMLQK